MYIQEWTDFNIFTRDPSMALRKIGDDEGKDVHMYMLMCYFNFWQHKKPFTDHNNINNNNNIIKIDISDQNQARSTSHSTTQLLSKLSH